MKSPFFGSMVEVAEYLGRSPRTIRRWVKAYRIPCFRTMDGQLFFRRDAIEDWIKSGFRDTLPPPPKHRVCTSKTAEPPTPPGQMRTSERRFSGFKNVPPRF